MKYFTRNVKGQDGVNFVSIYVRVRYIAITGHAREEGLRRYLKLNAAEKAVVAEKEMNGFMQ